MQERLKHTKGYHTFFYFVCKETTHKPLKVAAIKTLFSSVYVIGTLPSMNIFYSVITGKNNFHDSLSLL